MTNQEIYIRVKELISIPTEFLAKIEKTKEEYIKLRTFNPDLIRAVK
jgi:hypothetical protein